MRIDTDDLPLSVIWAPDSGDPEPALESPIDRVWLTADRPGVLTVALDDAVEGGRTGYRVRVTDVDPVSSEAARESVEGTRLMMQDAGEAQDRALVRWERAADAWERAGQPEDAAFSVLASAHGRRSRDEVDAALPLYEQAIEGLGSVPGAMADALDGQGLVLLRLNRPSEARAAFGRALEIRRRLGYPSGLGITQNNLCYALQMAGELRPLADCYDEAADLFRQAGRPRLEALIINNLGGVRERLGEPLEARDLYRRALDVLPETEAKTRARLQVNLGVVLRRLGELGEAVVQYNRALPVFREQGDARNEARTLHNLGAVYGELGEPVAAVRHYEDALALRREQNDPRRVASTLGALGGVLLDQGEISAATAVHREALDLYEQLDDRRGVALSTSRLGSALGSTEPERSLELLRRAVELAEATGDTGLVAANEDRFAKGLLAAGEVDAARATWHSLLERIAKLPLPDLRLDAHRSLADLERAAGRFSDALVHAQAAEEAVETLRASVPHAELRATLLATRRPVFETHLEILMELHRREPDAGHAREALEVSEQARARALLDLIIESDLETAGEDGRDDALRGQEAALRQRIRGKLQKKLDLLWDDPSGEITELDRDLTGLYLELGRIELALRLRNPSYEALSRPEPLTVARIQGLLPSGTVLLEYALGEHRSYVWAVTADAVHAFELPARGVLDGAAREAHQRLSVRRAGGTETSADALAELSRLILAPVAEALGTEAGAETPRLVVVPDGALHFIPFAALPHPGTAQPLMESHEIAHLPSVTVLAARRAASGISRLGTGLAVLADPVFTLDDERMHPAVPRVETAADRLAAAVDPQRSGDGELGRLPASGWEAEAIAELLPTGGVWKALGFEARRDDVVSGKLEDFRFVHFATHGVIDADRPRASGLLLSRYDPTGSPRDGFVSLSDVYALDLRAELVVLSGCETALGREIRGEGLMGLTYGFLHAGADRVMASLWRVQDRATAELMRHFYRSLLVDGAPPAAALREAQRAIRRNRRWRDPYYWAPFILQGDWQPLSEAETP